MVRHSSGAMLFVVMTRLLVEARRLSSLTLTADMRFFRHYRKGLSMKKAVLLGFVMIPGVALAASGQTQDKRNGLICRESLETGSRLSSKRICMTREQWEQARRDARDAVDQAQMRQTNPKGG
jgi:hypothetical protein